MRALEKKPERRFQSMEAFAEAIAPFGSSSVAAGAGGDGTRPPQAYPEAPRPSSTFLESSKDTPPERRTSRLWTGVALAAVAVLVTMAAGVRLGSHLLVPSNARQGAAPLLVTPEPPAVTPVPAPARPEAPSVVASVASTASPAASLSSTIGPATSPSSASRPRPSNVRSTRPQARPAVTATAGPPKDLGF
jgi:hypothetical protein